MRLISLFSKSSWIKANASGLSYKLGVNGKKKLIKTGILLIKMDTAHSTLVKLEILTVQESMILLLWKWLKMRA